MASSVYALGPTWTGQQLFNWCSTKETHVRLQGPGGEIGFDGSWGCHPLPLPGLNCRQPASPLLGRELTAGGPLTGTEAQHQVVVATPPVAFPSQLPYGTFETAIAGAAGTVWH